MDLKEEIIKLMVTAKETGEYFNPHFLSAIAEALHDVYGFESDTIDEWINGMWQR